MKRIIFLTFVALLILSGQASAQVINDECSDPIVLTDVLNYCSPIEAFTNVGATPSAYAAPTCFGNTGSDVWFAFTALATDVTVTIRGNTFGAPGGTLNNPQVAIYFGGCGGVVNLLECQSGIGTNVAEAYQGGLFVGSTYLIRIQGAFDEQGTFQICINNYNPPVEPTSDCPDASILCDKSPFVVQKVTGAGFDNLEMEDADCFFNGVPGVKESNSTWFVWTCSKSGTLEFSLSPLNLPDDLDFVVYRLPNGIDDCSGKELVRCMASGEGPPYPSPCLGPTGLQAGDPDVSEDAGCQEADDDSWLAPLDMIAGESYALVVNNFSSTGNGFAVEFGGTGEFLGPQIDFKTIPEAVCLGIGVQVVDASTFPIGQIIDWKWSFGADAIPQTVTGQGPHLVQFNTPGVHPVVLTLKSDLGCKVTDIKNVIIFPDVEVDTVITAPDCNGTSNGAVTIDNIVSGTPPYLFSWDGQPFTPSNTAENLGVGSYNLIIRDSNLCETNLTINVQERVLTADAIVTPPLCYGDSNGEIALNITNGKGPFQYNWGSGPVGNSSQGGYSAGIYTVQAIDNVLCKGTFTVTITDNPFLVMALDSDDASCFGADDGTAQVSPSGGVGNYAYQWSNGDSTQFITQLAPGQYDVTLVDGNNCKTSGSVFITQPPDVGISLLNVVDLICNGVPEGEIRVRGNGGRPPYQFSPDGLSYFLSDTLTRLPAGDYWVKVKDSGGCLDSLMATVGQPPKLIVITTPKDTLLDLGYTVDVHSSTLNGNPPFDFEWSPSLGMANTTTPDPTIQAIEDMFYIVKVNDEDGCVSYDTVHIRVNKLRPVYFPNIFKPDGATGFGNDFFTGYSGPAAEKIKLLRIYDRWGGMVYENKDFPLNTPNLGWDGTYKGDKVFGVFTWYAKVGFVDGTELPYEGSITVLR